MPEATIPAPSHADPDKLLGPRNDQDSECGTGISTVRKTEDFPTQEGREMMGRARIF